LPLPARKTSVFSANATTVLSSSKSISTESQKLSTDLDTFLKAASSTLGKLRADTDAHRAAEGQALAAHAARAGEQLQRMQESLGAMAAKDDAAAEALAAAQAAIKDALDALRGGFAAWSEKFKLASSALYTEIEKASLTGYQTVRFRVLHLSRGTTLSEHWCADGQGGQGHVAARRYDST
jgi:kinesin family protein 11